MPVIYHFTDVANLEEIFEGRALLCHRDAPTQVDVGDQAIKGNRRRIEVDCGPGGVVADYVPFYFATRSPMLFSIKCDNVENVSPDQRRLVYFVSTTEAAYGAGLDCVFSDGNAGAYSITSFEDDPAMLTTHVDWTVMRLGMWNNTLEDPDRRRRRMAEFLIHESVPLNLVTEIGAKNPAVRDYVRELAEAAGVDILVNSRPAWYF